MTGQPSGEGANSTATGIFLGAFTFSCFLFWWLPSVLFRLLGMEDPVHAWAFGVSFLGLGTFALGYFIRPWKTRAFLQPFVRVASLSFAASTLDACESLSYKATLLVAAPALAVAVRFFLYRLGTAYGSGEGIPLAYQAVLYLHLFLGFLFLGIAKTTAQNKRKIILASVLVILPRLLISLQWGRFFVAQAAVPILFIALARGWIRLSGKRVVLLGVLAAFLVFVPALARESSFFSDNDLVTFFAGGGSLRLFQDNVKLNLSGRCPPLFISLTDKTIPYGMLGLCTMEYQGTRGWPATLDRILTADDPATEGTLNGTGSNYLLELYLTGGLIAVVFGSVLFGFSSRCFVQWICQPSPFAGIWAECLSRALFAPRGDLGYVYERIPTLVIATLAALWLAWLSSALRRGRGASTNGRMDAVIEAPEAS